VAVSEEAADTVMEPDNRGVVDVELPEEVELEQAVPTTATVARAARAHLRPDPDLMAG